MGIAILWVMFFHSKLDVSFFPLLELIKGCGNAGVDIFMFVSGFGIYYSLNKNTSLKVYYKNRLLRILPYYLPIVLLFSLYLYSKGIWGMDIVIKNLLTISYWTWTGLNQMFDWYVPAILVVYMVAPLFYKFFKKNKTIACLTVIVIFYVLSFFLLDSKYVYLLFIVMRVPVFIAGFWVADYNKNHKDAKLGTKGIIASIIAFIIGFGSLYYVYSFYPGNVSTNYVMYGIAIFIFPLCMFYCYFFSLFPNFKFPFLNLCGTYSLTLYIFHERVMEVLVLNGITQHMDIMAFIITFILAIGWTKLIDYVLAKILTKFAPSF